MRSILSTARLATLLVLGACSQPIPETAAAGPPTVYTTLYPTTYFTQRIAQDTLQVTCPLPSGADALHWRPTRTALAAFQKADLLVLNGAGLEAWVATASLPESRVLDTSADFADELLRKQATTHSHGADGKHVHAGIDPHTWVDPRLAVAQARAIRDALRTRFPTHAHAFTQGFRELERDLDGLHARMEELGTLHEGRPLAASEAAYAYLGRRYGLTIASFDLDPDEEPQPSQIAEIKAAGQPKILLWTQAPRPNVERVLRDAGLASVVFSPCTELDVALGEDFVAVMNGNVDRLAQALDETQ